MLFPTKHEREKRNKRMAVKLNQGISDELRHYFFLEGIDPEKPELAAVTAAVAGLMDMSRRKPGRPKEYSRDWFLSELAMIFKRETGKPASHSDKWQQGAGPFMDLCRAMLIPASDFKNAGAEAIGKAFQRLNGS